MSNTLESVPANTPVVNIRIDTIPTSSPAPTNVIKQKIGSNSPVSMADIEDAINEIVGEIDNVSPDTVFGSTAEDRAKQAEFAKKYPYDTAEAHFHKASEDPFRVSLSPPKYVTNLDPALKEMRPPMSKNPQNIQEVLDEANQRNPDYVSRKAQSLEETKKLLNTCREKMSNYPKYLSYEGSMVLCVMLSLRDEASPHLSNLPVVDQVTIKSLVPEKVIKELDYFSVKFDENKDFVIKITYRVGKNIEDVETITLNMFNSVAHPRSSDISSGGGAIAVEDDGDVVKVGGKIVVDKRTIRTILGVPAPSAAAKNESEDEPIQKRQPIAGRNAYEIRADVLQMAIDWARGENVANNYTRPDDIIKLAKQFYTFVENKR